MRDPNVRAVIALSGGLDSCVLLAGMLHDGLVKKENLLAVSFEYGSRHGAAEQDAACNVAQHYGVEHRLIDLHSVLGGLKSSLLRSNLTPVPEGHYEEESMRQTVVPGRNLLFVAAMNAIAMSEGRGEVYVGIHAGDHYIYPDCRYMFAQHLDQVLLQGSDGKVRLRYPFVNQTKAEIVRRGITYGAPFQWTRTCYTTDKIACGRCGSCQERLEAFKSNGMEDPLPYQSRELMPRTT